MSTPKRRTLLLAGAIAAVAAVAVLVVLNINKPETFEEAYSRCVTEVAANYDQSQFTEGLEPDETEEIKPGEMEDWGEFVCTLAREGMTDEEFAANADEIIAGLLADQ